MKNILYIITASKFLQYFTDFVIHKQQLGFTVNTYMIENIGNGTFNDIKSFLDGESDKVQDDYYVLLGGDMSIVPSDLVVYPSGCRGTDSSYALSHCGNWWRSVGRFPAMDENQIANMCKAAISYEKQRNFNYGDSLMAIAATVPNISAAEELFKMVGSSIKTLSEFYTDRNSIDQIIDRINGNVDEFINYMGHGASYAWKMRKLPSDTEFEEFTSDDIPEFNFKQPHVLSWACHTADILNIKCLGSKFLKKGTVSFWGACAVTWGGENRNMANTFWTNYIAANCPSHIGELYLTIYKQYWGSAQGCKRYMLLGDPTLQIK